jgi:hypothetical protein
MRNSAGGRARVTPHGRSRYAAVIADGIMGAADFPSIKGARMGRQVPAERDARSPRGSSLFRVGLVIK